MNNKIPTGKPTNIEYDFTTDNNCKGIFMIKYVFLCNDNERSMKYLNI